MLTILIIPTEITAHPSSTRVEASQDVILNCSSSVDNVTYSWHRDGGVIPPRSRGKNNYTLTIPNATVLDGGMYYCIASMEGISVESNRANVAVGEYLCK